MIVISNYGNLYGPTGRQATPEAVVEAKEHFIVRIGLWVFPKKFFIGDTGPKYEVSPEILEGCLVEVHNLHAVEFLIKSGIHGFYRGGSDIMYSSQGRLLTFGPWLPNAIVMNPEEHTFDVLFQSLGVCTDFPWSFYENSSAS